MLVYKVGGRIFGAAAIRFAQYAMPCAAISLCSIRLAMCGFSLRSIRRTNSNTGVNPDCALC